MNRRSSSFAVLAVLIRARVCSNVARASSAKFTFTIFHKQRSLSICCGPRTRRRLSGLPEPSPPPRGGASRSKLGYVIASVKSPVRCLGCVSWVLALLLAQATPPPVPHDKPFEVPLNPPKSPQSCQQLRTENNKCENDLKSCDPRLVERLRQRCANDAPHRQ